MTQIAYSGLFWTQFRVSRDSFTDLTAGKATVRTFLPRLLTAASRIKNCSYRKIITYQTTQSNLPNDFECYRYLVTTQVAIFAPPQAVASEIVHQDALAYLNLVSTWARLFHVSASGLRPIAAEPQAVQGGTMEQSSTWSKICATSAK